MADKYSTIQQHQPLRVPSGWDRQEKALIVQLDEVFDDIYRRFGRLRFEDMGKDFRQRLEDDEGNIAEIVIDIGEIELSVQDIDGVMSSLGMTAAGIDLSGGKYIKLSSGDYIQIDTGGNMTVKSGGTLTIDSGNFSIDSSGNVMLKGAAEILSGKDLKIKSGGSLKVEGSGDIKIESSGTFEIESGGIFRVASDNLDVSETGLEVKSGLLKGDHYTPDGVAVLSRDDIVISTEAPDTVDGRVWIKPLDSTAVNYLLNVPAAVVADNFYGTLTTSGAVTGLTGTFSYRLKFLVNAGTSSGSGIDLTATVGGLTFTQHIAQGGYVGNVYNGERTFDVTVTSSTWLGGNNTLSVSMSASGYNVEAYKIKAGSIEFTATGTGSGGAEWKSCEIKVYKG